MSLWLPWGKELIRSPVKTRSDHKLALSRRSLILSGAAVTSLAMIRRGYGAQCTSTASVVTAKHGTINFAGPVVTVNVGDNIQNAVTANFPVGGPGGVLFFKYGIHTGILGNIVGRGSILCVGECGPTGERPIIISHNPSTGQPATWMTASDNAHTEDYFLAVDGLEITDGIHILNVTGPEGLYVSDCYMHHTIGSGQLIWFSHLGGVSTAEGKDSFGWFEAHDGEYSYAGGEGGLKHNWYISQPKDCYVEGVTSHSSFGHPMKFVTQNLFAENCILWTSDHDLAFLQNPTLGYACLNDSTGAGVRAVGGVCPAGSSPNPGYEQYISPALLDFAAIQSLLKNCYFKAYTRNDGGINTNTQGVVTGRGRNIVQNRARASLWGGEEAPNVLPLFPAGVPYLSCTNWQTVGGLNYWTEVAAGGVDNPCNQYLWNHFVDTCTFEQMNPNPQAFSIAVLHQGSTPRLPPANADYSGACQDAIDAILLEFGELPDGSGQAAFIEAPRPPGWVERAHVWMAGTTYTGPGTHQHFNDEAEDKAQSGVPKVKEVSVLPPHPTFD